MIAAVLAPEIPGTSPSVRRQVREARLRPQFAQFYPEIVAGQWNVAAVLADRILAAALLRGSVTAIRGRVLSDSHFDFRGGACSGGERDGVRRP